MRKVKVQYIIMSSSYIYKFKGRAPAITMISLMVGLCVLFAGLIVRQGGGLGGVFFCFGIAFFFLLIGGIFFLGKANIVIDDESISRTILGKRFKLIQWKDIERITVFPIRGSGVSSNVTGYNVISSRERSNSSNTGKIFFSNQGNDVSGLIAVMNIYIARFNIRIERVFDGTTTLVKSI